MANANARTGTRRKWQRSPWPYLLGLILLIVILWYIIRGLGPEEPVPMDEDATLMRNPPALSGTRAA